MIARQLLTAFLVGLLGANNVMAGHMTLPLGKPRGIFGAAAAAGCSGAFATDSFTEGGFTNLELNLHTKDSGSGWTDPSFEPRRVYIDQTNDNILSTTTAGGAGALAVVSDSITCFNYSVQMLGRTGSTTNNRIGVLGRFDATAGTGYEFRITGAGQAELRRWDSSSSQTVLASNAIAGFSTATNYTLRMDLENSTGTIKCFIDGVMSSSSVSTTYTTGKPGLIMTNSNPRGDNFVATYYP